MGSDDFLVMVMALPPALFACGLWWFVTHSGEDLNEFLAMKPVRFDDRYAEDL